MGAAPRATPALGGSSDPGGGLRLCSRWSGLVQGCHRLPLAPVRMCHRRATWACPAWEAPGSGSHEVLDAWFGCPAVTVIDPSSLLDRARNGHGDCLYRRWAPVFQVRPERATEPIAEHRSPAKGGGQGWPKVIAERRAAALRPAAVGRRLLRWVGGSSDPYLQTRRRASAKHHLGRCCVASGHGCPVENVIVAVLMWGTRTVAEASCTG